MKHIVTLLCSVPCECVCFSESVFDSCCYFYCFFGGLLHACAHVYVCGATKARALLARLLYRVWMRSYRFCVVQNERICGTRAFVFVCAFASVGVCVLVYGRFVLCICHYKCYASAWCWWWWWCFFHFTSGFYREVPYSRFESFVLHLFICAPLFWGVEEHYTIWIKLGVYFSRIGREEKERERVRACEKEPKREWQRPLYLYGHAYTLRPVWLYRVPKFMSAE